MDAKAISEAVDADGWPIVVGCHVRVTGTNRGRGEVVKLIRAEVSDGPGEGYPEGWVVQYRDREGRMRSAWAATCRVVKATTKAKRRQELADYQLEQASKAFTRRRGL